MALSEDSIRYLYYRYQDLLKDLKYERDIALKLGDKELYEVLREAIDHVEDSQKKVDNHIRLTNGSKIVQQFNNLLKDDSLS